MRRTLAALLTSAVLLAGADLAPATTVTATFGVSVTVDPACYVSANALDFGTYHQGSGALQATTTLAVRCTRGLPFTIALNPGATAAASLAQRLMVNGANTLQYNLYTSAARTAVWGDGTGNSAVVAGKGSGTTPDHAISETVYGLLPDNAANQNLPPGGSYTDTITVTLSY